MADLYIDLMECGEYADHLLTEGKKLVGLSKVVDVEALLTYVGGAAAVVDGELAKQGIKRSDVRTSRTDVEAQTEAGRKEIKRFYKHLGTLDDDVVVDRHAFFEGGKMGDVAKLKPADVQKKIKRALEGFAAPANAALPDKAKWQGRLEKARDALGTALDQKTSSVGTKIVQTAELQAARESFLVAYNNVAKPVVRGLLAQLGRERELKRYFKDLTVSEGRKSKGTTEGGEGTPAETTPEKPADKPQA
jgi:hypothetical protein